MIKAVIFDMYETLVTQFRSPLYYGAHIAEDAGVPVEEFLPSWRATDYDRATGKMTLEDAIEKLLVQHGVYSKEVYTKIVEKRLIIQADCFSHMHEEIIPMLVALKGKGVKIGLISNCYSEEAAIIRESKLFPFFDVACLSYEQGITKPNEEIFHSCMNALGVTAVECLYVGDGGSNELETARKLGMQAGQAVWYRCPEGEGRMTELRPEFEQIESPLETLEKL